MTADESLVLLESLDSVRIIRLNAPQRRNALDWAMLDELRGVIATVAADTQARAVVVTGEGRAFCAGADLTDLFGDRNRPASELREQLKRIYASFLGLRDLTVPTIAAVNGAAIGAGLNIALACDIVVAGPHARFGPTFSQIGLHPGGGCSWMMTRRMGQGQALAALLTGATIPAVDALRLGLAEFAPDDAYAFALDLATSFASKDPHLMAAIKRSVEVATTSDLGASLDFESWAQAASLGSDDFTAHLAHFGRV